MQKPELNFTSPRQGMQLCSRVQVSKSFAEEHILKVRRCAVNAMWDTGAVISGISRRLADCLELKIYEKTKLSTAAGHIRTFNDIVLLDLFINGLVLPVKAAVVDSIPGFDNDFLIGMDVIQCGDFSVTTDHSSGIFCVFFKPYPGIFRPMEDIFSNFTPDCIEDFGIL